MTVRGDRDSGSLAIEAAILVPAVVFLLCLVIAIGRLQTVGGTVDAAARSGARSASLDRTGHREEAAQAAVTDALAQQGVACPGVRVTTEIRSQLYGTVPLDTVTVHVTCDVEVNDLFTGWVPGGVVHMTGHFASVVDRFQSQ